MKVMNTQIQTHLIDPPRVSLRKVRKDTVQWRELLDSVVEYGVLQPVLVAAKGDRYELILGAHRLEACRDAGLESIPARVMPTPPTTQLLISMQITENAARVDTTPVEFAQHMKLLLSEAPTLSLSALGKLVGKSREWVREHLRLSELVPAARKLLEDGELKLSNALQLARLPEHLQDQLLPQALAMPAVEFRNTVGREIKRLKQGNFDRRQEKKFASDFDARPQHRDFKALERELQSNAAAKRLAVQARTQDLSPWQMVSLGIKWALQVDDETLANRRAVWEANVADRTNTNTNTTSNTSSESYGYEN